MSRLLMEAQPQAPGHRGTMEAFPVTLAVCVHVEETGGGKGVVSVCLGSELLSWHFPPCRAQR